MTSFTSAADKANFLLCNSAIEHREVRDGDVDEAWLEVGGSLFVLATLYDPPHQIREERMTTLIDIPTSRKTRPQRGRYRLTMRQRMDDTTSDNRNSPTSQGRL